MLKGGSAASALGNLESIDARGSRGLASISDILDETL